MARTKQEMVADFRRGAILDAARTVFARRGFAGGILDEIAQEAGIAKGTVYLYFKSKTEIYKAVLDHDMQMLKGSTLERVQAATGLREKIAAFTLVRLQNGDARREFFRIMDQEQDGQEQQGGVEQQNLTMTRAQYNDWLREPVELLAAAIAESAARGEIRPVEAGKVAWSIADMTRGSIQRRLLGQSGGTVEEEAAYLTEFAWAALTWAQRAE
jgi:TetR/AcrR family fatty acid metabolism transcriptional regulator